MTRAERLTTRNKYEMVATFLRLLDKHRVEGPLRERLMRQNISSLGLSLQTAYDDAAWWPVRKLREVYRMALPIHIRRWVQDRLIDPILKFFGTPSQ